VLEKYWIGCEIHKPDLFLLLLARNFFFFNKEFIEIEEKVTNSIARG